MEGFRANSRCTKQNSAERGKRKERERERERTFKRSLNFIVYMYMYITKDVKFFIQEGADEPEKEATFPLNVVFLDQIRQQSQRLPTKRGITCTYIHVRTYMYVLIYTMHAGISSDKIVHKLCAKYSHLKLRMYIHVNNQYKNWLFTCM